MLKNVKIEDIEQIEEEQKKLNKLQAERDDYRKQVVADFQKT